jgi:hypothetical protein
MMKSVLFVLLVALSAGNSGSPDTTEAFSFDPEKVETGIALFYIKSNIDGSNASHIARYNSDPQWLESFKWSDGEAEATLVRAKMDWDTFSVGRFEGYKVNADGERTLRNTLVSDMENRRVVIEFAGQKMYSDIGHYPWHSYDFDYASLIHTLPHLVDPKGSVEVGRADVEWQPQPHYEFKGIVTVKYVGREVRQSTACLVYNVDGAALEHRGGNIWIDAESGHLVDYEIDLPDEPGFVSGKMRLVDTVKMTQREWAEFVKTRKVNREE